MPLPSPYYEDADHGIVVYHADCLKLLPHIDPSSIHLLLTDPPYGIDLDTDYKARVSTSKVYDKIVGDAEPFDPEHLLRFKRCVIWGGNHFAHRLPPSAGWFFWDKRTMNNTRWTGSEGELAWTNVC